jgi:short-subunit dehydrogenase
MALVARRRERLEELAQELRESNPGLQVHVRPTDLTDLDDTSTMIDEVVEALGPVDVLVNNAGLGDVGALDLADWEKLHRMVTLNITALTFLTHRLYPPMLQRRRGGVLNVSSGFGLAFMPSFATYVGTKHFVTGFTESLHIEAATLGVTVTQACPGPVNTEFEEVAGNFTGHPPPSFLTISADRCAREVLMGFARGRALVIPSLVIRTALFLGARTPRWLLRLFYRPAARWMRARQLAAQND